jgi:hypothetical protein
MIDLVSTECRGGALLEAFGFVNDAWGHTRCCELAFPVANEVDSYTWPDHPL